MTAQRLKHLTLKFFRRDLWEIDPSGLRPLRRFGVQLLQSTSVVVREFIADQCLLHASALAFATLLSIVPLLALMFALLKGLGAEIDLEILILNHVAPGSAETVDALFSYVSNTSLGKLGTVGLITLVLSVLTLLTNIEKSFNHICGVSETRSLARRFSDYFSITALGPVLLVAAISMTTTLESQSLVKHLLGMELVGHALLIFFQIFPYLAMWAAFTGLYLFMPNTRINLQAAILGGAFGGILWQIVQAGYINFQFGVSRYNAIYGTMAALPIFMIWIYVSWLIVLLGLEVTFAVQNLKTIRQELSRGEISFEGRETAAIAILVATGATFMQGKPALSAVELSSRLHLAPRMTRNLLQTLVRLGFLAELAGSRNEPDAYQPARSLETLTPLDVVEALRRDGEAAATGRMGAAGRAAHDLRTRIDAGLAASLEGLTLGEMVQLAETKERGG